jgi:hypothetical protein
VSDLEYVLEKAGCYISKTEIDEICLEFELKTGDLMTYDKFKEIVFCMSYLGFSAENSVGSVNDYFQKRRLSHKRMSSRKVSSAVKYCGNH